MLLEPDDEILFSPRDKMRILDGFHKMREKPRQASLWRHPAGVHLSGARTLSVCPLNSTPFLQAITYVNVERWREVMEDADCTYTTIS